MLMLLLLLLLPLLRKSEFEGVEIRSIVVEVFVRGFWVGGKGGGDAEVQE